MKGTGHKFMVVVVVVVVIIIIIIIIIMFIPCRLRQDFRPGL